MNPQRPFSRFCAALLIAVLFLLNTPSVHAYSVLSHEQVVDFVWESHIKKLLLAHYPHATYEELRQAHAYAYGGCLIQDMGYYPFGNRFFSDLVHYVRSGDFVSELVREAHNINELAFALGALSHYAADNIGHPLVNEAVALNFPKLRARYGDQVTYERDPKAHIQTEFGFDVLQVAKQRYTSEAYHDFIGFAVAQPLLERAFANVYGIDLKTIFANEDRAIESYRHAVSTWIPRMTQVALVAKKQELEAAPNFSARQFRYLLSRTEYEKNWGNNYQKPGFSSKLVAFLLKLLPKVGALRALDIKAPTPETERLYIKSMEATIKAFERLLEQQQAGKIALPNTDFDTGQPTTVGEYELADKTYSQLLRKLSESNFFQVPAPLRSNILAFYKDLKPAQTAKHAGEWKKTLKDLKLLQSHS